MPYTSPYLHIGKNLAVVGMHFQLHLHQRRAPHRRSGAIHPPLFERPGYICNEQIRNYGFYVDRHGISELRHEVAHDVQAPAQRNGDDGPNGKGIPRQPTLFSADRKVGLPSLFLAKQYRPRSKVPDVRERMSILTARNIEQDELWRWAFPQISRMLFQER